MPVTAGSPLLVPSLAATGVAEGIGLSNVPVPAGRFRPPRRPDDNGGLTGLFGQSVSGGPVGPLVPGLVSLATAEPDVVFYIGRVPNPGPFAKWRPLRLPRLILLFTAQGVLTGGYASNSTAPSTLRALADGHGGDLDAKQVVVVAASGFGTAWTAPHNAYEADRLTAETAGGPVQVPVFGVRPNLTYGGDVLVVAEAGGDPAVAGPDFAAAVNAAAAAEAAAALAADAGMARVRRLLLHTGGYIPPVAAAMAFDLFEAPADDTPERYAAIAAKIMTYF